MPLKIAHISDIHIRFGESRRQEYKTVLQRTLDDLKGQCPDRICVLGDIYHGKTALSSGATKMISEFLIGLSKIAPCDVIHGNHDLNLQKIDDGDSLSPLFDIVNLAQPGKEKCAYIVSEQNKNEINFNQNAVYCYIDSGFYTVRPDLVYGIYSLRDSKIIKLEEKYKKSGVNYIALYHGPIYGGRGDNGMEIKSEDALKVGVFNGFNACLYGDFHSYGTFDRDTDIIIDESELDKYKAQGWEPIEYLQN